jgi:hypothetical protein
MGEKIQSKADVNRTAVPKAEWEMLPQSAKDAMNATVSKYPLGFRYWDDFKNNLKEARTREQVEEAHVHLVTHAVFDENPPVREKDIIKGLTVLFGRDVSPAELADKETLRKDTLIAMARRSGDEQYARELTEAPRDIKADSLTSVEEMFCQN